MQMRKTEWIYGKSKKGHFKYFGGWSNDRVTTFHNDAGPFKFKLEHAYYSQGAGVVTVLEKFDSRTNPKKTSGETWQGWRLRQEYDGETQPVHQSLVNGVRLTFSHALETHPLNSQNGLKAAFENALLDASIKLIPSRKEVISKMPQDSAKR